MQKPEVNSCTVGERIPFFSKFVSLNPTFDLVTVGRPPCAHRWEGSKTVLCGQIVNTRIGIRQMTDLWKLCLMVVTNFLLKVIPANLH